MIHLLLHSDTPAAETVRCVLGFLVILPLAWACACVLMSFGV